MRKFIHVFLPEVLMLVIASPMMFSTGNALAYQFGLFGIYLLFLMLMCVVKACLFRKLLATETTYTRQCNFITCLILMMNIGCFMNLYIVGFRTGNFSAILEYILSLLKPPVLLGSIFLMLYYALKEFYQRQNYLLISLGVILMNFITVSGLNPSRFPTAILESAGIALMLGIMTVILPFHNKDADTVRYWCGRLAHGRAMLFFGYTLLNLPVFFLLRGWFSAHLSMRVAVVELDKLLFFFGFYCLMLWNDKTRKKHTELYVNYSELAVLFLSLMTGLFLLGEHGTMIVMLLMLILMLFLLYSTGAGLVMLGISGGIYGMLWVLNQFISKDFLDRLFNLQSYRQIRDVNQAILESSAGMSTSPYAVDMVGTLYTRIEDFSYLNLISVFGRWTAVALILLYLLIPLISCMYLHNYKLKNRRKVSSSLFTLSEMSCLLLFSSGAVHVMSNFGLIFFTGVTLPFISNGFMNIIVMLILLIPVIYCLREASLHDA
ncbi:MAG: hypothetical protein IJ644_09640 [Oscillospiraceae bacterium]|nr:hypothetical protein [Oscillospiraceae bacterium]